MKLKCNETESEYSFVRVAITFDRILYNDVFSQKNNKTVAETLEHKRYVKYKDEIIKNHSDEMYKPLGSFLLSLKKSGNEFYKCFLNKYGDLTYSIFKIVDSAYLDSRGVYAYISGHELKYIGRCKDSMKRRVNQGYGKIHPKNCYIDGQTTNCHLNARITAENNNVSLWLHQIESEAEIETREKELIRAYDPLWNLQRG